MAKLTDAQRAQKKIEKEIASLEKTKIVIKGKLDVLNQALGTTEARLIELRDTINGEAA
jgi:predicted  nucleic acid-binding Zn-ribbon protein